MCADDVGRVLYRCALPMLMQAHLQPKHLDTACDLRPDLLFSLPGWRIPSRRGDPSSRRVVCEEARATGKDEGLQSLKRVQYTAMAARVTWS